MTRPDPSPSPGAPTPGSAGGRKGSTEAVPVFGVRDLLPDIILPKEDGSFVRVSYEMTGKKLLLLFCSDPALPGCRPLLTEFARHFAALDALAHVFLVTSSEPASNQQLLAEAPLPFIVLSDLRRQVAQALEVGHNLAPGADGRGLLTVVVADENRRILRIERDLKHPPEADALIADLRSESPPPPRTLGHFAPVLYVPSVLEPELTRELIAAHEEGDTEVGRTYVHDSLGGEHVVDPAYKVRRDFYVTERDMLRRLQRRLQRRVLPEIKKALTREVTGIEEFKVVCYDGNEGGHFCAHRDNASKHFAHRRFAMTLNLNTGEYDGGALRFPEYGPDLYVPDTGDAVVFSCSLLHEATPVTRGRRFVLLSFLFDEESRRLNDRFSAPGEAARR